MLALGMEEEYFLVDKQTRKLIHHQPADLMQEARTLFHDEISHELFACQIEIASKKCHSIQELHETQQHNRLKLQTLLDGYGLQFVSAGSYPSASHHEHPTVAEDYYDAILEKFPGIARRLLVNGMHVHVQCKPQHQRIQLLNQLPCFLPIFLALSASSAFFNRRDTGLQSYRICLLEAMPISGMPEGFHSTEEYDQMLDTFHKMGYIDHPGNIYWHVRVGNDKPTLEMRIVDSCPKLEDAIAIAALYAGLLLTLSERDPKTLSFYTQNPAYTNFYLWQTRRFPLKRGHFIHVGKQQALPFENVLSELLDFVRPMMKKIDALPQLEHLQHIYQHGTSATRQRRLYQKTQCLDQVCQSLIEESHAL